MKVFTVSQINKIIKDLIDNEIVLEDITVTGELSSFSVTRNVAYFTLKDKDNLLSCIQFGNKQQFKIGDMVQCRGNVKYYPKGGKISFNALNIELCGQGELYQQFLELKKKLEVEGLFDEAHKIAIPRFVKSIGVVTSEKGAVLQDIKNVTSRRNPNLDIYVYNAQVQGKFAVSDVIEGITYFDNFSDVDVIIVARGGGSLEDLMPFNDEELARIAFICNKPIISAVGHETDFTILDFVADLRAPTPSAAAELVTFDCEEVKRYVKSLKQDCEEKINNKLNELNFNVKMCLSRIEAQINDEINDEILFVNDLINNIYFNVNEQLNNTIYRVKMAINTLDNLNPLRVLNNGYCYVTVNGQNINNQDVAVEDNVLIRTKQNKITAKVLKKENL